MQSGYRPSGRQRRVARCARARLSSRSLLLLAALALVPGATGHAAVATVAVLPSALDPNVQGFDHHHIVMIPDSSRADAPFVLFLTGTGGHPSFTVPFEQVIAGQGWRVVSLAYENEPAVAQVCPQDPDMSCAGDFREMRIWGDGASKRVSNAPSETIDHRLVLLLKSLDTERPGEGWSGYLKNGEPDWSRIVVSGISQGAGMAAYIAKRHETARVVLFSSPWDWVGPQRIMAPWMSAPSATPPDRWFAEYHRRELTEPEIKRAYGTLQIPADHIRIFDRDIPQSLAAATAGAENPYHSMTVQDPAYADDWRAMFGRPPP